MRHAITLSPVFLQPNSRSISTCYETLRPIAKNSSALLTSIVSFNWDFNIFQTPIHKRDFPKHLHDLITLQTRAGWNQLYFGRFTIEWINQQEDYSLSQGYKDRSEEWMTGLISIIFKRMHERWKLRCTTAHEDNPNNESQRHTQLKNEITQLFDLNHLMPSHTHHIFSPPLQTLLLQPIPSLKTWIECNKSFINKIITQHHHDNLTSSSPSSQTNSDSLT